MSPFLINPPYNYSNKPIHNGSSKMGNHCSPDNDIGLIYERESWHGT